MNKIFYHKVVLKCYFIDNFSEDKIVGLYYMLGYYYVVFFVTFYHELFCF